MPLYTLYPTRPDGISDAFEIADLPGDADVVTEALRVLAAYESAMSVVIYCDNREVLTQFRSEAEGPQGLANLPQGNEALDACVPAERALS